MPENKEKRFRIAVGYEITYHDPESGLECPFDAQEKIVSNAKMPQVLGVQQVLLGALNELMAMTAEHAKGKRGDK